MSTSEGSISPKRNTKTMEKVPADTAGNQFHIVGIGASAGGLEAFGEFFKAMPDNSGIAFVLVSHLDPHHSSILPELIQKKTKMSVSQVHDNMKVLPDHVYIIPPNKEMAILNGYLQLLEMRQPRGANLPIDTFLRSLAQDQKNMAIGIILSGTGTDGTLGVRSIKGEAGMVMVQDTESAKYDGMPRSALSTGLVDFTLPPAEMPKQLIKYVNHQTRGLSNQGDSCKDHTMVSGLQKIFVLLRSCTGHDFSFYKKNTIFRRIERRMHVLQLDKIEDYVRYLQNSEREVTVLFKELLIGVTSFFRDYEAFEALKDKYLPDLFCDKPDDYQFRIWVPGCSTGEEVYSIAIIVQECMEKIGHHFIVQIFGTDLDEDAIAVARAGIYPESIAADVSPQRLQRFFNKYENTYQIKKNIRELVVFATQNVVKDPPFTKLDMLCCRNLLIYFGQKLQKKLLPVFHYSLKPGGILFLGSSETIGQDRDLFTTLDKKWKIFKRPSSGKVANPILDFPTGRPAVQRVALETPEPFKSVKDINIERLLRAILAESGMPACVVIDDRTNILYIHGRVGRFLEPPEGVANISILEMARAGLKAGLTAAIRKVSSDRREITVKGLQVKENGNSLDINLVVRPLPDLQAERRGLMMVLFEEVAPSDGEEGLSPVKHQLADKKDAVKRLEDELQYTRENLQTTIEELETSNEELKSTNEELQSTNEELQSTNEELETSKEELQSLNEESVTVNSELQSRINELLAANDDIKNLLDATNIATLFLDIDLNVRRFTSRMTTISPLTNTDLGRPIKHFTSNLIDVDLHKYAQKVLNDLDKQEVTVLNNDGTNYLMRLRPYRTVNNVIEGVVITFEDVTELKQLLDKEARLAAIVKDSNDAITLLDLEGNILAWNRGAEKLYGYSEQEALKMNIKKLYPSEAQGELENILTIKQKDFVSCVCDRVKKNGENIHVWLSVTGLFDDQGRLFHIATTERDVGMLNVDALKKLTRGADDTN